MAEGLNDTADNFLASIAADEPEVAPSSIYAAASILEGVPFINGSPQNTFVPGLIELAVQRGESCSHNPQYFQTACTKPLRGTIAAAPLITAHARPVVLLWCCRLVGWAKFWLSLRNTTAVTGSGSQVNGHNTLHVQRITGSALTT